MHRAIIVAVALALLAGGVIVYVQSQGCSGTFRFHYTSRLSQIMSMYEGGADARQCELLAEELLNMNAAAVKSGMSQDQLAGRLVVDAFQADALGPDCRITYTGKDASETMSVLNVLVGGFVEELALNAREEREQIREFLREEIVELAQRKTNAESSDTAASAETWTVDQLEDAIERLNEFVEAGPESPTVASPIVITQWPQLSASCETK